MSTRLLSIYSSDTWLGGWPKSDLLRNGVLDVSLLRRGWGEDAARPFNLVRYQQTGHLHFVTFRCYRRQQHLGLPAARELLERSLEQMRSKEMSAFAVG